MSTSILPLRFFSVYTFPVPTVRSRDLTNTYIRLEIDFQCSNLDKSNIVRFVEYFIAHRWLYMPFDTNLYI